MGVSRLPSGGFSAARFREAIRGVWEMAATPEGQPVTFIFPETVTTDAPADGEGVAFDPAARLTRVAPEPVRIPCGVEYRAAGEEGTPFGTYTGSSLKITCFDEDYQLIKDARWVELEGERYQYAYDEAPQGLFTVGIHTLIFHAESER